MRMGQPEMARPTQPYAGLAQLGQGIKQLAQFRLRFLFRSIFFLLACATLGLAASVLQQEKQLSYDNYTANFNKTRQQILATLRHPSGQLALLNPPISSAVGNTELRPLLLPFAALDFDDPLKVEQAITLADCLRQYGNAGALCVGIGNNPWVGGFIYVAGHFNSSDLVAHPRGQLVQTEAHRVHVSVALRGQEYVWLAPFEEDNPRQLPGKRGRLTGFLASEAGLPRAKPVKDFRGWVWQKAQCKQADAPPADCEKHSFFSLRLPVAVLQDALFDKQRPQWPPADLAQIRVRLRVLAAGSEQVLLDSSQPPSAQPYSLADLQQILLPGETLQIFKTGQPTALFSLTGKVLDAAESWNLLTRLIRRLPVDEYDTPLNSQDQITTPLASYEIRLQGDVRSVNKSLSVVATRLAWFVGAMLAASLLAWYLIEVSLIRRITRLARRARSLSRTVKGAAGLQEFDISDLRNGDELGILASCLHDLLRRVQEDVERESIRAEQEKQMWHAVGHEIMSPLQSLMVLHQQADDPSNRYIHRMQQAVRVLYGSASPSEAFQSTVLQVGEIDLAEFLQNVANNAPFIEIRQVNYSGPQAAVLVRADEYSLEDVVTHVLRNADRFRQPDSPISITLHTSAHAATISIHNQGPQIAPDMLEKIFEYGVSDQPDAAANGNRGQGLFVAKTYMAKMGGTITAHNVPDGVEFVLGLQRIAQ